jgi:hypothetical protein
MEKLQEVISQIGRRTVREVIQTGTDQTGSDRPSQDLYFREEYQQSEHHIELEEPGSIVLGLSCS